MRGTSVESVSSISSACSAASHTSNHDKSDGSKSGKKKGWVSPHFTAHKCYFYCSLCNMDQLFTIVLHLHLRKSYIFVITFLATLNYMICVTLPQIHKHTWIFRNPQPQDISHFSYSLLNSAPQFVQQSILTWPQEEQAGRVRWLCVRHRRDGERRLICPRLTTTSAC